jgi:hypothetical protein
VIAELPGFPEISPLTTTGFGVVGLASEPNPLEVIRLPLFASACGAPVSKRTAEAFARCLGRLTTKTARAHDFKWADGGFAMVMASAVSGSRLVRAGSTNAH